jgi:hypothetical protein
MSRWTRSVARWTGWLVAPLMLAAVALAGLLVLRLPFGVFGKCLAVLFALPFLWILVSVLWPARADRTCPRCGGAGLRRIDPGTTHGVACSACGWRDEGESAWLLAEEEGPLEEIVLAQRRRRATGGGAQVDSAPRSN